MLGDTIFGDSVRGIYSELKCCVFTFFEEFHILKSLIFEKYLQFDGDLLLHCDKIICFSIQKLAEKPRVYKKLEN